MDAVKTIKGLHQEMRRTVNLGGDALGTTSGGRDRAKGYLRATLDATVAVLSERADDGRTVSYALARAVLDNQLDPEEALSRHASGFDLPP